MRGRLVHREKNRNLKKIVEEHGMLKMLGTLHYGCSGMRQGRRVTSCGNGLQRQQGQKAVVQVYHSLFSFAGAGREKERFGI